MREIERVKLWIEKINEVTKSEYAPDNLSKLVVKSQQNTEIETITHKQRPVEVELCPGYNIEEFDSTNPLKFVENCWEELLKFVEILGFY